MKKLELLTELCTTDNAQNIVDELGWAACDLCSTWREEYGSWANC